MEILKKVQETIRKNALFSGNERILIGLSGGPDSVCLLYVLKALKKEFRLDLHTIYVDHGLRPKETPREIEFCKRLCTGIDIPFVTKSIDVRSYAKEKRVSIQEAARDLRYHNLEERAFDINAHKIALGHTADDQAETVLMRLLRGSGPVGLCGIPPIRGMVVRPLIEIKRTEIDKYLREHNIDFVVDSSNIKRDYLRNEIRLSLMQILKEVNPNIIETLSKTAAILRDEEIYLENMIAKTLPKLISRKSDIHMELFLPSLVAMDKVILRRALRRAINETRGLRGINFVHIEDIIELIRKGRAGDRLSLPDGVRAIKGYSTFIITSEPLVKLGTYIFEVPGEIVLREASFILKASITELPEARETITTDKFKNESTTKHLMACFDAEKITFPLTVRSRRRGDFFYPSGFGKKKKLQDLFVDEKVPRDERDRVPLIVSQDDIIWVIGYRTDERFKVTEETKRILKLEAKEI